ncbi:MAG: DUF3488 and transglutaminase-like domain-containing protein [Thermoanaerobaculia bacterium]|nr:DUF3488 and transglutaminase-like domain-containing protein [Thermoanaerobaculia bacterium]
MSFSREKRVLLGLMAWIAPIPLPFNELLAWPLLVLYLVVVTGFLHRASEGAETWLPNWAMNLLGLAYLPVLFLDFTRGGQLLRPVIHVALFGVAVKLFALRREKDKWQVLMGIFFLFLASMGTSVHPTMVLYLVAFLALGTTVLTRFSVFSVLGRFGYGDPEAVRIPLRSYLVVATACSILVAIPLFAVLPRLGTPYIMTRGTGTRTEIGASGFTDVVTLDSIGSIRNNPRVVLRVRFQDGEDPRHELRIKGATFEAYRNRAWRQSPRAETLRRKPGGRFELAPAPAARTARFWLRPLTGAKLPVPVNASEIEIKVTELQRDRGGALSLSRPSMELMEYDVGLADRRYVSSVPQEPKAFEEESPALDTGSVTPRMAELADEVMGELPPREAAQALERYLAAEFEYSTELLGKGGDEPLENFLFRTRRGHCEYFASSMVLLLRSRGIPARLVTGFLGGERNRIEDYFVVRQSNAHAWVEAHLPESGWALFDPTPPEGRPQVREQSFALLFTQAWDYVVFRWDRYVLTYGLYDQMQIFRRAMRTWRAWWSRIQGPEEVESPAPETTEIEEEISKSDRTVRDALDWQSWITWLSVLLSLGALLAGTWMAWRFRRSFDATRAYERLRSRLDRAGLSVKESTAPLALQSEAEERFPEIADPSRKIVDSYLVESFGESPLAQDEVQKVRESLQTVNRRLKGLRKVG